jgi:Amt family ammonium transporter
MFFQMTFAIITPALIAGALADRMKFSAFLWFMSLWLLLRLLPDRPLGVGRRLARHAAGRARLRRRHRRAPERRHRGPRHRLMLGKRKGLGTENMAPHNLAYSVIGASLLWVGWFGFNAGSAVESHDGYKAGMAAAATQIATAPRRCRWMFAEWIIAKKPSRAGHDLRRGRGPRGHHAGLGLRQSHGRADHRLAAGVVCYFSAVWVKKMDRLRRRARLLGRARRRRGAGRHDDRDVRLQSDQFRRPAPNGGWLIDGNAHQMLIQFYDVARCSCIAASAPSSSSR